MYTFRGPLGNNLLRADAPKARTEPPPAVVDDGMHMLSVWENSERVRFEADSFHIPIPIRRPLVYMYL